LQQHGSIRRSLHILLKLVLAGLAATLQAAGTFDIYCLDVEEGSGTLLVAPSGQTILIDGGNARPEGRDAGRFLALAKELGIKRIDYLVVTHYHGDHYGATPEIARNLPIVNWIDHGPNIELGKNEAWEKHWVIKASKPLVAQYEAARERSRHRVVKPGDDIAIGALDMRIVTAGGNVLPEPLPGAGQPNASCAISPPRSEDETEDGQSVGMIVTFGRFRFAFLGDLTWNKSLQLFCPKNLVGPVDVYQTSHHGMSIERAVNEVRWGRSCCSEAEVHGLHPRAAILNSGEKYHRSGNARAWQVVRNSPGLEDFWQLHYAAEGGKENNVPAQFIANLTAANCRGRWIKLSAEANGAFTVTNTRNGFTKRYAPRP
jgi:competence protein ComEC